MDAVITRSQMHKHAHVMAFFALFVFVSRNLRKTESRKNKLEDLLNSVGARVNELKEKYAIISYFSLSSPSRLFCFTFWKKKWFLWFSSCFLFSKDSAQIVICNTVGHNVICICSPQAGDTDNILVEKIRTTWLLLHWGCFAWHCASPGLRSDLLTDLDK